MAAYSNENAYSATLSSTTVDTVTIVGRWRTVEVVNWASVGGADIWFAVGGATPTVAGAGCYKVPPQSAMEFEFAGPDEDPGVDRVVKILGNGNDYSVSGVGR